MGSEYAWTAGTPTGVFSPPTRWLIGRPGRSTIGLRSAFSYFSVAKPGTWRLRGCVGGRCRAGWVDDPAETKSRPGPCPPEGTDAPRPADSLHPQADQLMLQPAELCELPVGKIGVNQCATAVPSLLLVCVPRIQPRLKVAGAKARGVIGITGQSKFEAITHESPWWGEKKQEFRQFQSRVSQSHFKAARLQPAVVLGVGYRWTP